MNTTLDLENYPIFEQEEFEMILSFYLDIIESGIKTCPLDMEFSFTLSKPHKKKIIQFLHNYMKENHPQHEVTSSNSIFTISKILTEAELFYLNSNV